MTRVRCYVRVSDKDLEPQNQGARAPRVGREAGLRRRPRIQRDPRRAIKRAWSASWPRATPTSSPAWPIDVTGGI